MGPMAGGKWESEAVGELQALRVQQQWKRRPVLVWGIASVLLALLALRTRYTRVLNSSPPRVSRCPGTM
jgi:hypothetical protein